MMKYCPAPSAEESARFREDFALVIKHVRAADTFEEKFLRRLALRACRKRKPARWPFHDLKARQRQQLDNYRAELSWRRQLRRQVARHHARLLARGVTEASLWHYPYRTPGQRREDRERLCYIRYCQRTGLPIPWDRLQ